MKVAVFSSKPYDREFLSGANSSHQHDLVFFEPRLAPETLPLAAGFPAICVFVNDRLDAAALEYLAPLGLKLVALRCAGFNNVDLFAARKLGVTVVRVPAYSPQAVAEHTLALLLALNRHLHRAFPRVREGNFSLDGLLGFDLHCRTVGVIGTGRIGTVVARILRGFGCTVLAHDSYQHHDCLAAGVSYVDLATLYARSDIITLHCPLTPDTHHLIDANSIAKMRPGVMLINTSRGALVDTRATIDALKSGQVGSLGIDVYEEEADLFFEDLSNHVIRDDVFARLLTFPNVVITGHQAFFTREALGQISSITLDNISAFFASGHCANALLPEQVLGARPKTN